MILSARPLEVHIPTYVKLLEVLKFGSRDENKEVSKKYDELMQLTVDQIMTHDVITVTPEDSISHLVGLITAHRINPVPVVNKSKEIVGIVSRADLLKLLKWLK